MQASHPPEDLYLDSSQIYPGSIMEVLLYLDKEIEPADSEFKVAFRGISNAADNWNLYSSFECAQVKSELRELMEKENAKPIFRNLAASQYDIIMQTLHDAVLRTNLRDNIEETTSILKTVKPYAPLEDRWRIPEFITTKPIILPKEIRHDREKAKEAVRIHIPTYQPRTMSEAGWNNLVMHATDEYIYPMQYCAIRMPAARNRDDEYIATTDIFERFKNNEELYHLYPEHCWLYGEIGPDGVRTVQFMDNLMDVLLLHEEVEAEFHTAYLEKDIQCARADQEMTGIPNSDPTNYKHFSKEKAQVFDCLAGQGNYSLTYRKDNLKIGNLPGWTGILGFN
jgi:hypothetical protein